jgi:regulator of protease activity HflC (stomatin/prohibitin superfamily)
MKNKTIHYLLLAFIIIYLVTGFGITEYQTVEALTFGILSKNLSFRIHEVLWIPLIILSNSYPTNRKNL